MKQKEIIVGMDVGTSHIRVIVGEHRSDGTINIIGVGLSPSEGIRKGFVVDQDKTIDAISRAVEEAERMAGIRIESAFISLVGLNVQLLKSRGVATITAEDREIRPQDVERALENTKVALPSEREIVEVIAHEYIVDGYDGIKDPVGMLGVRLEVDAVIVTTSATCLQNLIRCIKRAGIEIEGIVLQSFANGEITLTRDEKELGVFVIDIGGGTTEIAFFKNGILQDLSVLPIGGNLITNDLSVGLHTSYYAAENLKIEYGCALQSAANTEEKIEIITVGGKEKVKVSAQDLARYIGPRVQEILQFAREEMFKMAGSDALSSGVVLTGGVSLMEGLTEIAEEVIGTSIRIGEPQLVGVQSPIYTTAVGIIYYVIHNIGVGVSYSDKKQAAGSFGFFAKLWKQILSWFNDFFE